jgi:hypothetical protein
MEVLGIERTKRRLGAARDRSRDLRGAWPAVGDDVAEAMAMQFMTEGVAGGRPWAPLKPEYRQWKVKHNYDPRTLLRTRAMRDSLTSRPMDIEEYHAEYADFGSTDEKLPFHQYGTRRMPRREVLFWHEPLVARTVRRVKNYIVTGVPSL